MRPGEDGRHPTFCRLCEAYCGLVATVEDGAITGVEPDRDNPHSQGHACVKGVTFADVTNDPDRITTPMKRVEETGAFVPVSWEDALDDIAVRLKAVMDRHGGEAFAFAHGNPVSFHTDFTLGTASFLRAIGASKVFHAGSQDHNSRSTANWLAFGAAFLNSFPDLVKCDFLMILGANPLVSNGSLLFAPRIRHDLDAIAERGKVIVVDPRRTETARRYDHVPVRPAGDVWLLLGMLRVLIEEDRIDHTAVSDLAIGWEELRAKVLSIPLADAAHRCGIDEAEIRAMSKAFAQSERAAIYGRIGLCRNKHGTLANFLLTALNCVAGKFGREGGTIFPVTMMAGTEKGVQGGYERRRINAGEVPAVGGSLPCALLPEELLRESNERVRAMFVYGANFVLTSPGGSKLVEALQSLELFVACDLFINETNCHAHYVLPGTTFFERPDLPFFGIGFSMMRPFLQYTEAVVEPVGDARDEFEILAEIARRLGKDIGVKGSALAALDGAIRMGPAGDHFGKRENGWSFDRLRRYPHGVMIDGLDRTAGWRDKIGYPDRKIRVWHDLLNEDFNELVAEPMPEARALQLIGRRDIRSMNSWLHNVDRLVRSQRAALMIHPDDALVRNIGTGSDVTCRSAYGSVVLEALVTDEVRPGTVCYPHGWGHTGEGSWLTANHTAGKSVMSLFGHGREIMERLAGMTVMDGIAVSVEPWSGSVQEGAVDAMSTPVSRATDTGLRRRRAK